MHRLNVEGTKNMLAAARAAGAEKFVHVSSLGVLGAWREPRLVDEDHPVPRALFQEHRYHRSKK
jgi:nucleoside-diphosphate-sugar epimerase